MINKPPPLNREYNGDPNIKAIKTKWCINHGSTLPKKGATNRASGLRYFEEPYQASAHQTQLPISATHIPETRRAEQLLS